MTELLIRIFIGGRGDPQTPEMRTKYGFLSGSVGICVNVLLSSAKFLIGAFSGSIAIVADGFNNLSDSLSCILSLAGFKFASKPPDDEHPYGHGRAEYIAGLVITFLMLLVGVEFVKSSFGKILSPEPVLFSWITLGVLFLSVAAKLWLWRFYSSVGGRIGSETIKASAQDSLNDVVVTLTTTISVIAARFTDLPVDGYVGLLVSGFILYSGLRIARDTLNPLLGQAPDAAFAEEIKRKMASYGVISDTHDLAIHSYGPGRTLASIHAEVPADSDFLRVHSLIDRAEHEISAEFKLHMVIHTDPIEPDGEKVQTFRAFTEEIVRAVDPCLSVRNFRMISDDEPNLIFELELPEGHRGSKERLRREVTRRIEEANGQCNVTIEI